MPAKDRYHDALKRALLKEGWAIDDEQITLTVDERHLWIDLQISHHVSRQIFLVEVKELSEVDSPIEALANALGKIALYRLAIRLEKIEIPIVLAVSEASYNGILSEVIGQHSVTEANIPLIVFNPQKEEIVLWML